MRWIQHATFDIEQTLLKKKKEKKRQFKINIHNTKKTQNFSLH